jgi:maltodextrin utilization protein YvdJ
MNALIACPVCFGQSDAPMAIATNMGIWMMLGVVVLMLASFAAFFITLNRRARLAQAGHDGDGPVHVALNNGGSPGGGPYLPNPQEGTARC